MYFADEVRDFGEINKGLAKTTEAELGLAVRLIDELPEHRFKPEQYTDEYRERVLEFIHRKEVTVSRERAPRTSSILWMRRKPALEKSTKGKPARAKGCRTEGAHLKKANAARR